MVICKLLLGNIPKVLWGFFFKFNPNKCEVIRITTSVKSSTAATIYITRLFNRPVKLDIWVSPSTPLYRGIRMWLQLPRKQTSLHLSCKGIYLHVRRMSMPPTTKPWCASSKSMDSLFGTLLPSLASTNWKPSNAAKQDFVTVTTGAQAV